MDWLSVAFLLADALGSPVFALDGAGRVQLFNSAMERLLGWHRHEVLGQAWAEEVAAADPQAVTWFLGVAMRGGLRTWTAYARSRAGDRLKLELTVLPVGRGHDDTAGVVCIVETVSRESVQPDRQASWIEINTAPHEFGLVIDVHGRPRDDVGKHCYEVIADRNMECKHCPFHDAHASPARSRWTTVVSTEGDRLMLVNGVRHGGNVRVFHELLDAEAMVRIVTGRFATLAESNDLSEREHQVLDCLVLGLNTDDIAERLSISPRTVKFHQTNVLTKLGIASRLELLRLLVNPDSEPERADR